MVDHIYNPKLEAKEEEQELKIMKILPFKKQAITSENQLGNPEYNKTPLPQFLENTTFYPEFYVQQSICNESACRIDMLDMSKNQMSSIFFFL